MSMLHVGNSASRTVVASWRPGATRLRRLAGRRQTCSACTSRLTSHTPMDESDRLDQIGRSMQQAWSRVKNAQSRMWGDWMTIGEGLLEGRRWAMQAAGTNKPEGKGYVTSFGEWLTRWKVHDMDKSDRAKLLQLMEERPAVEEWRATLTDHDRRMLNHPLIVWR